MSSSRAAHAHLPDQAALADAGLGLVGEPRFGAWSEGWGRAATAMLLDRHPELDAVLCGSDQIARGVMEVLRERSHRVPDDIAVMGFDNRQIMTAGSRPPPTSVDMNLEQVGRAAAHALFAAIAGTSRTGIDTLPCKVVIRGSTAPLS
ncbi:substrate-binding protein-like domain-containing protein [Streptomyces sp. 1222.2]|uniref:substrate-binding domain-containing protein n=1 Tax=Streptomyces sp. 1222.2 TaxID=1938833 RepID=UPI000BCB396A|nr:substrate-binding domain-containing protein [Streptomyces sp. 1222.2]SOD80647.1 substrate-binding protein-like domain-containing protein [Streptomyces sp. 1222.2]